MSDLKGMNALVTGGGSGLGVGCARRLLRDGATVTIVGRSEDRLRAAAGQLRADARGGTEVRWQACDVTDETAVAAAVRVADEGDGLRIVVTSAGVGWLAPIATIPVEAWRNVLETNLTGNFLVLKHSAPRLRQHGGGAYTAISSLVGGVAVSFLSPYAASKAGLDHLVRSAADELGRWGIRVNAVSPSAVPTELGKDVFENSVIVAEYLDNMPIRRLGTPEDVAAAVRYLSGPEASWVTGVVLPVDGGHHLRRAGSLETYVRHEHGADWLE